MAFEKVFMRTLMHQGNGITQLNKYYLGFKMSKADPSISLSKQYRTRSHNHNPYR